jgi:hypothetical protein
MIPKLKTPMTTIAPVQQLTRSIPTRSGMDYREFASAYLFPNRPVILTDGLAPWKAVGRWTPEFLRDTYPSKTVVIDGVSYSMRQFIERVQASGPGQVAPYFRNREVRSECPELMPDLTPSPDFILPNWLRGPFYPSAGREAEIYIGGAGGGFPFLHYDSNSTHAFLGQVYGEKEAILYAPEDSPLVYTKESPRHHSWITDVENPDFTRFPLFAKAVAFRGVLKPGSLLFIPNRWWHTARMLSPSITVSYNVANRSNWRNVTDEICYKARNKNAVIEPAIAAYMKVLGWGQSFVDLISGRRSSDV